MNNAYEVNGWSKFTEEDVYSEGCLPETMSNYGGHDRFIGNTVEEVLEKIMSFTNAEKDWMLLNSCDDVGRVDVQVNENEDGYRATEQEIKQWKQGKLKLWLATYIFYVKECKDVDLSKFNLVGYAS